MGDAEGPLVLVVDDDPSIVQLLDLYLRDEGFQVRTACDGKAALASALEVPPDILVLDVMTPEMDGIEVVHRLRGQPDLWDVPVVLLSARSDEETIARGLLAGANAYVTKPFDLDALTDRLRLLLAAAAAGPGSAPVVHAGAGGVSATPLVRGQEALLAVEPIGVGQWVAGRVVRGHSRDLLVEVPGSCSGLFDDGHVSVVLESQAGFSYLRHSAKTLSLPDRGLVALQHDPNAPLSHRSHVRVQVDSPAQVIQFNERRRGFRTYECRTVDLSQSGTCLRVPERLETGVHCGVAIALPEEVLHLAGDVVETSDQLARIRFRHMSPEQQKTLGRHVFRQLSERARRK
jgi:CheY-like chemotaxis protein